MNTPFQKFSLQNLLRQFFCGVVFFIPLYQFAPCQLGRWLAVTSWGSGDFLLFSSVAIAVGTIIYHLEKNLYSYPLMYICERYLFRHQKVDRAAMVKLFCWWFICCVIGVVCLLALGSGCFVSCFIPALMLLSLFWLVVVTRILLESSEKMIVDPTLQQWRIEYEASGKMHENNLSQEHQNKTAQYAAAEKIAKWSDFIHCVQSCCFAWIFGSLLAYRLTETVVKEFYEGLAAAFVLLAAEMVIDVHRYRFVRKFVSENTEGTKCADNRILNDSTPNQEIAGSTILPAEDAVDFREYTNANIATSRKDVKKKWKKTFAHRCWIHIPQWKLGYFKNNPFVFDCFIDGKRYIWAACCAALRSCFEDSGLRKAKKKGNPYSVYLDYKNGLIYNSPNITDEKVICRLTAVPRTAEKLVFQQIHQKEGNHEDRPIIRRSLPECKKRPKSNYAMSKSVQEGTNRCFFNLERDKLQQVIEGAYIFDCEVEEGEQTIRSMWCAPSVLLMDYCERVLKPIKRQDGPLSYSLYIDYHSGSVYGDLNTPVERPLFCLTPVSDGTAFELIYKSFK